MLKSHTSPGHKQPEVRRCCSAARDEEGSVAAQAPRLRHKSTGKANQVVSLYMALSVCVCDDVCVISALKR